MSDNRITIDETHTRTEGEWTLSKDTAFQLLQNPRRRAILRYLLATDDTPVQMDEIAEAVAAWECDISPENLPTDDYQRVYVALYQTHFPKLNESNIIKYHEDRGTIEPMPLIHALAPYLEDGLYATTEGFTVAVHDTTGNETKEESGSSYGFVETLIDLVQR